MNIVKNPRTDVDVQLLWNVFPDMLPDGRAITHEQIEAVLKVKRSTSWYRNVVSKWRRQLFQERRVYLDGQIAHGRGFVVLAPDEMVRFANRRVRSAGRRIRKAIAVAAAPNDEELSADVRRYRGLLAVAMAKIANDHKSTLLEVGKALAPMKQLPRQAS